MTTTPDPTADLLALPDGNWVDRFGRPCPGCNGSVFAVALVRTSVPGGYREAVDSYCPRCTLLSHGKGVSKTVIGRHDLVAGVITLTHYTTTEG